MHKNTMKVVGIDGNADAIIVRYIMWARKSQDRENRIEEVLKNAKTGDYEHLLAVISNEIEQYENKNVQ